MEKCQTSLTFKKCTLKQHHFSYFKREIVLKMIRSSDVKDAVKWAFWFSGEGGDAKAVFWNALFGKFEKYLYLGGQAIHLPWIYLGGESEIHIQTYICRYLSKHYFNRKKLETAEMSNNMVTVNSIMAHPWDNTLVIRNHVFEESCH